MRRSSGQTNLKYISNVKHIRILVQVIESLDDDHTVNDSKTNSSSNGLESVRLMVEFTNSLSIGSSPLSRRQRTWDLLFESGAARSRCIAVVDGVSESLCGRRMAVHSVQFRRPRRWLADSAVTECAICGDRFSAMIRKHHCRRCGNVLCHQCSSERAVLPKLGITDCVRVCWLCYGAVIGQRVRSDGLLSVEELHRLDMDSGAARGSVSEHGHIPIAVGAEIKGLSPEWQRLMAQKHGPLDPEETEWAEAIGGGIPSVLRGYVWSKMVDRFGVDIDIDGDDGVHIDESKEQQIESGKVAVDQPPSSWSVEDEDAMQKDVDRMVSVHSVFGRERGRLALRRLLRRYGVRKEASSIGYCQSMSFLGGVLLLFLSEEEALCAMVHLLESESMCCPLGRHHYHQRDLLGVHLDGLVMADLVRQFVPDLHGHLVAALGAKGALNVLCNVTVQWFLGLMVGPLSMTPLLRIWDRMICGEGIFVIFRAALSVLRLQSEHLLRCKEMGAVHHWLSTEVLLKDGRVQNEELLLRMCSHSDFDDVEGAVLRQRAFHGQRLELRSSIQTQRRHQLGPLHDDDFIASQFYNDLELHLIAQYTPNEHGHDDHRHRPRGPSPNTATTTTTATPSRRGLIALSSPRRSLSIDDTASIRKEIGMNLNRSEIAIDAVSVESVESESADDQQIVTVRPSPLSIPLKRPKLNRHSKSEDFLLRNHHHNEPDAVPEYELNSSPFESTLLISKSFHRDLSRCGNRRAWSLDEDVVLIASPPQRPLVDDFVRIDSAGKHTVK